MAGRDGPNTHPGNVESWNGCSWTETTEMGTARRGVNSSVAPYTAVLAFGGYVHPGYSLSVELWNGSTWSEQTEISEGHYAAGSGGTSTSAITAGGQDSGPSSANTETWDGSSWSEEADLNTGRVELVEQDQIAKRC